MAEVWLLAAVQGEKRLAKITELVGARLPPELSAQSLPKGRGVPSSKEEGFVVGRLSISIC